jgi:hypothetical protein
MAARLPLPKGDTLHEADVALLDEVQELQPTLRALLRDRHHEAEARLDERRRSLRSNSQ